MRLVGSREGREHRTRARSCSAGSRASGRYSAAGAFYRPILTRPPVASPGPTGPGQAGRPLLVGGQPSARARTSPARPRALLADALLARTAGVAVGRALEPVHFQGAAHHPRRPGQLDQGAEGGQPPVDRGGTQPAFEEAGSVGQGGGARLALAHWPEHPQGKRFWFKLDRGDFGLLQRQFRDQSLLAASTGPANLLARQLLRPGRVLCCLGEGRQPEPVPAASAGTARKIPALRDNHRRILSDRVGGSPNGPGAASHLPGRQRPCQGRPAGPGRAALGLQHLRAGWLGATGPIGDSRDTLATRAGEQVTRRRRRKGPPDKGLRLRSNMPRAPRR
jgi:hypothetical protein